MENITDYLLFIKEPWGRMFYDLVFWQLNSANTSKLEILDFGSGFGVTANQLAKNHNVVAVEPNKEMIANRYQEFTYQQLNGNLEVLKNFTDNSFDFVICHNVLEYVQNREEMVSELLRITKPQGKLSIIKHNQAGRIFQLAVFGNNPQKALAMLNEGLKNQNTYFGSQDVYSNEELSKWMGENTIIDQILGIRSFWALGQNNEIKYTDEWYDDMLALEKQVANIPKYCDVAFFQHLLIKKLK